MINKYAQAVVALLLAGKPVSEVLEGLKKSLAKNRHEKLFKKVLVAVSHTLDGRAGQKKSVVTLAREGDEKKYAKEIAEALSRLGVAEEPYEMVIDDTIIGGHMVASKDKRIDQSYKHALQKLYRSVVGHT